MEDTRVYLELGAWTDKSSLRNLGLEDSIQTNQTNGKL